jgi:uncharacterized protein YjbI with pentapeptide repeats
MATKIFKILAASIALSTVIFFGTELTLARPGGGHVGGGGGNFGGGGGHFGRGGANFSGAQFRSSGISGTQFRSSRISGAQFRSSRISHSQFRSSRISGTQLRSSRVSSSQLRSTRISGARTLAGRAAWNQWGNHHNHWRGGWHGGWGGSTYWPYFYGDLFAFALWPYDYYDPFWAYGDIFVWDAMFWPGPDYAYGPAYDVYGNYAYGGPARSRTARARNVDREITGSTTTTNSNDLAQTCGGLAPGVTDLPVDYIEEAIKPIGEQLKALDALKAASAQASDALKTSCPSEVLHTPLGRLDTVQTRLDGMIQAVGIVRTPLDNFYNSLSEEQRQRFATLGPASDAQKNRRGSASGSNLAALCSRRTESFTQLPVERIEQSVKPTQEQQDAFARLKIASTEAANQLQASCPTQTPQSPMDRFDALAKRLGAMAEAIKTVRPALASFYGSLTDEQKARFNTLGPPQTASARQG